MTEGRNVISYDDFRRDPHRAAAALVLNKPLSDVTPEERERAKEAVYRALHGRFQLAAKTGDTREERRLLEELGQLLKLDAGPGFDGLEIIVRGKPDRGKTTTARLIEKHLSEEAGYTDVKVGADVPPTTDKDRWWDRFQRTRARPVRIKVETVK